MKYLVTTEMMEEKVPTDPQKLVKHVETVIQQHEIMVKLEDEKVILAGGGIVGRKAVACIIDAASHNELLQLIYGLPLHHVHDVEVIPLADLRTELDHEREGLERLKPSAR